MAANYILGRGEELVESRQAPQSKQEKAHPYNLDDAVERLTPQLRNTVAQLAELPPTTKPDGHTVALFTLHPAYLAKSYFPSRIMSEYGFVVVGSRGAVVKPTKWTRKGDPEPSSSVELFVSGHETQFVRLLHDLGSLSDRSALSDDIIKFEAIRYLLPQDRIIGFPPGPTADEVQPCEIVVHDRRDLGRSIMDSLQTWFRDNQAFLDLDRVLSAGSLLFVPGKIPIDELANIGLHSFVRVLRPLPELRPIDPIYREAEDQPRFLVTLPKEPPINADSKVAIVDGGLRNEQTLSKFVGEVHDLGPGNLSVDGANHGHAVLSALLFGPLRSQNSLAPPSCRPSVVQVLGRGDPQDLDLFTALSRIITFVENNDVEYLNLSLGPRLPIEDNEVHVWTAVIDDLVERYNLTITVAVGNDGGAFGGRAWARCESPGDSSPDDSCRRAP